MKKVLLLEDTAFMFDSLKEKLEENHYEVVDAYQVSDAMGYFKHDEIDFLIVDLYVPPTGLPEKGLNMSEGGKLAGWIWLRNHVFPEYPDWKNKVIIYAATCTYQYPDVKICFGNSRNKDYGKT